MRLDRTFVVACAALVGIAAAPVPAPLTVDRVVMVMRHGVRPPTKAPALPTGVTTQRWPDWPVAPGWLTPHGAAAISAIGEDDRRWFVAAGLIPAKACPTATSVAIIADSDQRTIATADAWAAAIAPGCTVAERHRPQGESDPMFSPIGSGASLDQVAADAAVAEAIGPDGTAGLDRRYAPLLARLDAVLCPVPAATCGVRQEPTGLKPARLDSRPKLTGALDRASTAAQVLLLEYVEGKPMADVGWGRATAADIATLSAFHALEFRLLARPKPIARANLALITPVIAAALTGTGGATVTMISGHDTQVANLGGLLDLHWHVPGFAADDPAPGGAILIERLSDRHGGLFVRLTYRAQTLRQTRDGGGEPFRQALAVPGCRMSGDGLLCRMDEFLALLNKPNAQSRR